MADLEKNHISAGPGPVNGGVCVELSVQDAFFFPVLLT